MVKVPLVSEVSVNIDVPILTVCELPLRLNSKESACSAGAAGDTGSIPGSGRSLVGGHGNPLQCSCLENSMDRGAWQATVHGVKKSRTRLKRLSRHAQASYH